MPADNIHHLTEAARRRAHSIYGNIIMLGGLAKSIFGSSNDRYVKSLGGLGASGRGRALT